MVKNCRQCQADFEITNEDFVFYDKVSPIFQNKKYLISPPALCPDCRKQRRITFRNEKKIYNRSCDFCHKDGISLYSLNKKYKVFCQTCWWGDSWVPFEYGMEYNFLVNFFSQYALLMQQVPQLTLYQEQNENSGFTNYTSYNKNCYLIYASEKNEDCYYLQSTNYSSRTIDCSFSEHLELSYQCIDCLQGFQLFFCQNSHYCSSSSYLFDCRNCHHCFACVSLQQKEFCFLNQQLTKDEYQEKIEWINSHRKNLVSILGDWEKLKKIIPRRYYQGSMNELVTGDNIYSAKNSFYCFDSYDLEDCKYCTWMIKTKNSMDCYGWGLTGDQGYELQSCGSNFYHDLFCSTCVSNTQDLLYCINCVNNTKHCFGCIGLKHAEYCILNKQYTKEEYESLVPRIIEKMKEDGEWGEFFPPSLSPFGYNETVAQEYYPLTKEEALSKGFNWSDYEPPPPKVDKILNQEQMKKLPDKTSDIPDDILSWALTCEVSNKPYRIIKQELQFYREHNLPIPRRHPDQRHKDRMALRNPRKLFNRTCMKCERPIQTTYSPDRKEIVYCEECYLKEVY